MQARGVKTFFYRYTSPITSKLVQVKIGKFPETSLAETALGHSRKGIEGTYDLHRYEAECRQWLQKWADHLDALIR